MDRNSSVLIGLLAVAGSLLYVGSELNKTRRTREANVKSKDKKKLKKDNFDNRVIAGFRQSKPLEG